MMLAKSKLYSKVKSEEGTRSASRRHVAIYLVILVSSNKLIATVTNMMGLAAVDEKMQLGDFNVNIRDVVSGSIARSLLVCMCKRPTFEKHERRMMWKLRHTTSNTTR
ncbi:hypothetical protein IQ06DRAFT_104971 [Phaeosphaeriaceae sp. SRC1lsM3a]|nr:hypothetical protein IQ06DRAFT_104971 [Stagonospora sp. SRC1lsM3a]